MNLLQITDLGTGQIQVSWHQHDAIPRHYPPISFHDPIPLDQREQLRWYLEEYLSFPYGAERNRAQNVEDMLASWGEALFAQVFPKGEVDPDPRAYYQEAVRAGLETCQLCVSSEDSEFLNLPWELLRDPTPGRGYLAPSLGGLFRQRSGLKIEAPFQAAEPQPFRILLVIARPYGESDVPLGTVARPVVEAIRALRPQVELEVLRPPTFDALVERLNRRRGYFQLVHFDGHGVFAGNSRGGPPQYSAVAGRGHLVFENEDGSAHIVNSHDLGQALAACHVPLFVLNACQSAQEGGTDPFSSVAAQLVAVGARGVVAMSHSVYADTAALFMQRFYARLVAHSPLAEAVAAGRQRLHATPDRNSVIGPLELRDWMVPVLYQQDVTYIPISHDVPAVPDIKVPDEIRREEAERRCPEGRFGFVGRDYDILRLERALRSDDAPWALISGLGGSGKTALAYGFARWYAETGGCPGGVYVASFREKADFAQVVGSIVGYGTDFSRLPEEELRQFLVQHLRENACLLVWDNFETVAGYPRGTTPLATAEEQGKLSDFLRVLRGGKSRVIITTRSPEEAWLDVAPELVEIRGLVSRDAAQLAQRILRAVGCQPSDFRDDAAYSRLLNLLRGHPRSLEVILPHLRSQSPGQVIHTLQHSIDTLGDVLEASLDYGFGRLSPRTQRHLPLLGLFATYVHVGTVANFVSAGDAQQEAYAEVMGEALDAAGWAAVLEEARAAGLVRMAGPGLYELHPTLPRFLRRRLHAAAGEDGLARLDREFRRFFAAWAAHYHDPLRSGDESAVVVATIEEANLLRALRLAEAEQAWAEAQAIVQSLGEYYEMRSRTSEWNALRRQFLAVVGQGDKGHELAPDADRDRADLWM